MKPLTTQIVELFILAIPIACIARTVVWEEVFREPREWCKKRSQTCDRLLKRKFYYLFTCEYCFSHWVTIIALAVTHFQLLYTGWRGYVVAFFSLVFIANAYLSLYARLRVDIASEKKATEVKQKEIEKLDAEISITSGKPAIQAASTSSASDT